MIPPPPFPHLRLFISRYYSEITVLTMEHKWGCRLHSHMAVHHLGTASFFRGTLTGNQLGHVCRLLTHSSKAHPLQDRFKVSKPG